jgi:hypothetical protein
MSTEPWQPPSGREDRHLTSQEKPQKAYHQSILPAETLGTPSMQAIVWTVGEEPVDFKILSERVGRILYGVIPKRDKWKPSLGT